MYKEKFCGTFSEMLTYLGGVGAGFLMFCDVAWLRCVGLGIFLSMLFCFMLILVLCVVGMLTRRGKP